MKDPSRLYSDTKTRMINGCSKDTTMDGEVKSTVLVSVLLTNFNNCTYIPKAIESLLAQTYQHWELVAVDDASTDESLTVLKQYEEKHSRIRVYQNEMNYGAYYTLNECLRRAKGEYFVKLDSDDMYHPEKLELQLKFCQQNGQGLSMCKVARLKGLSKQNFYLENENSTLMFSRDIFNKYGYFDSCRFDCDTEYIRRLSRNLHIPILNKVLDYKHTLAHSLTQSLDSGVKTRGMIIRRNYQQNSAKYNPMYIHHPQFLRHKFKLHYHHSSPIEVHLVGNYTVVQNNQNKHPYVLNLHILDCIVLAKVVYKVTQSLSYTLHNTKKYKVNIKNCRNSQFYLPEYTPSTHVTFTPSDAYVEVNIILKQGYVEYTPLRLVPTSAST